MTGLFSLPEEVLLLICERLRQSDVYHACLTCSRLSKVANNDALYYSPYCQQLGNNASSTSLLCTICTQPRRARLIRHLRFNYVNHTTGNNHLQPHWRRAKVFEAASLFERAVQLDLGLAAAIDRRARRFSDSDDLALALIIPYAIHLESLMLGNTFYFKDFETGNDCAVYDDRNDDILSLQIVSASTPLKRPDGSPLLDGSSIGPSPHQMEQWQGFRILALAHAEDVYCQRPRRNRSWS